MLPCLGFNLSKIVPNRNTLHQTEIAGFYHLACVYYSATNQMLKAAVFQKLYDLLSDLSDDLFNTKMDLFESLCIKQLEEINKRLELLPNMEM